MKSAFHPIIVSIGRKTVVSLFCYVVVSRYSSVLSKRKYIGYDSCVWVKCTWPDWPCMLSTRKWSGSLAWLVYLTEQGEIKLHIQRTCRSCHLLFTPVCTASLNDQSCGPKCTFTVLELLYMYTPCRHHLDPWNCMNVEVSLIQRLRNTAMYYYEHCEREQLSFVERVV